MQNIIGNIKNIKLLNRIVATKKIANAYLFFGPESVGKFTAALAFAKKITVNSAKIDSDLVIIKPDMEEKTVGIGNKVVKKKDIKIEIIKDLQRKLSLSANNNKYKVAIIDEAERLNKSAQNALLKTLEEPNDKVVLILVAQNEKKILPTIISRCQKIHFELIGDCEIEKIIPIGNTNKKDILFWSIGRMGIAKNLMDNPIELENRKETLVELKSLFLKDVNEKFALAEAWSKNVDELQEKMDWWLIILRQIMLGKKIGVQISPAKALLLIENIAEQKRILQDTNANTRLSMENLLLKF